MKYVLVMPFFNEEQVVSTVITEAFEVLQPFVGDNFIMVGVDDGSTDGTLERLKTLASHLPLKVFHAKKRGGQAAALYYGCRAVPGEIYLTMDGDGQNDPKGFEAMLPLMKTHDLIQGVRQKRQDTPWKRLSSKVANRVRRWVLKDPFVDIGCNQRVFRKEVLQAIPFFTSLHRFLPLLSLHLGFRVCQVSVPHRPRLGGKSKYHTWDRLKIGLGDLRGVRWLKKRIIAYPLEEV